MTDAEAMMHLRGGALRDIRANLRYRNDRDVLVALLARLRIKRAISSLRKYGPGPVAPVETGGGELIVPETWWGPERRKRRRSA